MGCVAGAAAPPNPPRAPLERFALSVVIMDDDVDFRIDFMVNLRVNFKIGGKEIPKKKLEEIRPNGVDFLNLQVEKRLVPNFRPNRS